MSCRFTRIFGCTPSVRCSGLAVSSRATEPEPQDEESWHRSSESPLEVLKLRDLRAGVPGRSSRRLQGRYAGLAHGIFLFSVLRLCRIRAFAATGLVSSEILRCCMQRNGAAFFWNGRCHVTNCPCRGERTFTFRCRDGLWTVEMLCRGTAS